MSDRRVSDERRRSPPRSRSRSRSPVHGRRESRYRSRSRSRDHGDADLADEEVNPGDNLFVTGLSSKTTSVQLEELFAKHGTVHKAEVMYDPHTRESRGFGFIQMQNTEDANRAMDALNGADVDGRPITVEKAKRARPRTPTPGRYHGPPKRGRHVDRFDPRGGSDYRYRQDSRYYRGSSRYERPYDRYMDRYEAPPYPHYERDHYSRYYNRYDRRDLPPRYDPYTRPRSPY